MDYFDIPPDEAVLLRRIFGRSQKIFEDRDAAGLIRKGFATLHPNKRLLIITEQGERKSRQVRRNSGRI